MMNNDTICVRLYTLTHFITRNGNNPERECERCTRIADTRTKPKWAQQRRNDRQYFVRLFLSMFVVKTARRVSSHSVWDFDIEWEWKTTHINSIASFWLWGFAKWMLDTHHIGKLVRTRYNFGVQPFPCGKLWVWRGANQTATAHRMEQNEMEWRRAIEWVCVPLNDHHLVLRGVFVVQLSSDSWFLIARALDIFFVIRGRRFCAASAAVVVVIDVTVAVFLFHLVLTALRPCFPTMIRLYNALAAFFFSSLYAHSVRVFLFLFCFFSFFVQKHRPRLRIRALDTGWCAMRRMPNM